MVSSSVDRYLLHVKGGTSQPTGVFAVSPHPSHFHPVLCVSLTCVFAALAALDEAEDEQYEHQQHDGADESNQPTAGGEAPGNLRWH